MKKNIALVLGSGGARGIAHIGVINELIKQGYNITSISGTSMGALVGGMYATGELKKFEKWMSTLSKLDVFKLIDFTLSLNGVVKGNKIVDEMKKMIPDRNIEDLPIPFSAVATNIINGKEVVFSKGSLYDAIRASISIPTVFKPFNYNGQKLVDGGVLNPIPINRVKRNNSDLLIAVNLGSSKKFKDIDKQEIIVEADNMHNKYIVKIQNAINNIIPKNKTDKIGYYNLLNQTTALMIQTISELTLEKHKPDVLIEIPRESFGIFEFYKSQSIVKLGVSETKKALLKKYEYKASI